MYYNEYMKKIYTFIILISIVSLAGIGIHTTQAQSQTCTIDSASFAPQKGVLGGKLFLSDNIETLVAPYPEATLQIKSKNCDDGLKIFIKGMQIATSDFETGTGIVKVHKKIGSKIVNIDDERSGVGINKGTQDEGDPGKALVLFPKQNGEIKILYNTSSHGCYDDGTSFTSTTMATALDNNILPFDCYYYPEIFYKNVLIYDGSTFFDTPRTTAEVKNEFLLKWGNIYSEKNNNKVLLASCSGECDYDDWDLKIAEGRTNSACTIGKVSFSPLRGDTITLRETKLTIENTGCYEGFYVSLYYSEPDMVWDDIYNFSDSEITGYPDDEHFIPPLNKPLILSFKTSEDTCYEIGIYATSPTYNADCKIGVRVFNKSQDGNIVNLLIPLKDTTKWLVGSYTLGGQVKNYEDGVIFAECNLEDGPDDTASDCDVFGDDSPNWAMLASNAVNSTQNAQFIGNDITYDVTNPCYRAAETVDGVDLPERYDPLCYEFLAPILGIHLDANGNIDPQFDVTKDERTGQDRISIRNISTYQLGSFINKLFQVAVAVLGVIAVIMIIVAGVEYMTVESIYGKSDARKRIVGAATGLILALGIFVILNTINPQLLNINFGENLESVSIQEDEATINEIIATDKSYPDFPPNLDSGTYTTKGCPEGIVKRKGMYICKTIADKYENMINKAAADGIVLLGGGFRTSAQQAYLRRVNGCPDLTSPSKTCRISTAPVGTSNHEQGLAVDLECTVNGQTGAVNVHEGNTQGTKKEWTRPCFNWLKSNAAADGFFNFKGPNGENWHWSVDGR
jgi:hypothetical protein